MYIAIDIGGTKTLLAVFDKTGTITEQIRFPTPKKYGDFLAQLGQTVTELAIHDFRAAGLAVPGILDRDHGVALKLGNLNWKNISIQDDVEKLLHCPVVIENDAKLAGLSEAILVNDRYKKVLYITLSTGVGIALINDGDIDTAIGDGGGHDMYLEYGGKQVTWEEIASGKSLVERYGKRASDIDDPTIWKEVSGRIAVGLIDLIAIMEPDVVIVGGGVGTHLHKYKKFLVEILKGYEMPMSPIPPIIQAKHAEEAVIYGCYSLAKKTYDTHR